MFTIMERSNPPATLSDVERFERDRSLSLPTDYKEFLLATNGGVPKEKMFPIIGYPYDDHWQIMVFLGTASAWATETLNYSYDNYVGGIPQAVVPIAIDDLGNYVCLDLRKGSGQIAFWDHRHFWGTGEWREQDLYHVADSFEQFLNLLEPALG
jgi:cell wall assembly regulator SMI1